MERTVGVLGGMGPEATVDFFAKVVSLTRASKDQEHLRIIIDNNPKIPDRTESILAGSNAPAPLLVETARNLERAGADFIAIPCNTAHYLYEEIVKGVSIPVLHMIREVAQAIKATLPNCSKVGLLATTGTVLTSLYQNECGKYGIEVLIPDDDRQKKVMDAILKIKGGSKAAARAMIEEEANKLLESGSEALILGCTDIPLVITPDDFKVPIYDSTLVLAEATVKFAKADPN